MQEAILHPPRTLLEVYKMLPEGTRAELIDNSLYMSPAPTSNHQDLSITLAAQLYNFCNRAKSGKVFASPIDVYLNKSNAFQPDIVYISTENLSIIKEDGIYGAPDLVIEILSPGTKKLDLTKKKDAYENAGVKEYWVVDPATKDVLGFHPVKGKYVEFKKEKGKVSSALLKRVFKF
jgi:Uma2 family endonuclease